MFWEKLLTKSYKFNKSFTKKYSVKKKLLKAAVDPKSIIPGRAADKIYLIHFNDVANVESGDKEPVGGAARFVTSVKQHSEDTPLVLFSGNAFSPSESKSWCHKQTARWKDSISVSTYTKGEQMVPVLNMIGTQCAVFGNHDFGRKT